MRHMQTENRLKEYDVNFTLVANVAIERINVKASINNQARYNAILPDKVEEYVAEMARGVEFPPLVGYEHGDKIVLIDGNQRLTAALQLKKDVIDVYLVDTSDLFIIDVLTRTFNNMHGALFTKQETFRNALALMRTWKRDMKEVAVRMHIKPSVLSAWLREKDARDRAYRLGVKIDRIKSDMAVGRLGTIKLDAPFAEACRIANGSGLSESLISEIVSSVNLIASEQGQLDFLKEERKKYASRLSTEELPPSTRTPFTTRDRIFTTMNTLQRLINKLEGLEQGGFTSQSDVDAAAELWKEISRCFCVLVKLYGKGKIVATVEGTAR